MKQTNYNKSIPDIGLFIRIAIMVVVSVFLLVGQAAYAQQFIIDDAAVTTERSIQIESWYGEFESEFVPAISVTSWLEAGVALAFDTKDNFSFAGYALEAKAVSADFEEAGRAFGLFAGFGFNNESVFEEFVAYVPYSQLIFNESSALHLNLGIAIADNGTDWETSLIYGFRTDIGLHERFTLLTEVFAENDVFGVQAGGRFGIIPGLLEMDVMYGSSLRNRNSFPGFTVGLAFTPDSLW
ncbi:MAG: hypothetical protein LAT67_04830 [Balneolales bacterium]|nr:hypothetical protein [Balneolales bacterium]